MSLDFSKLPPVEPGRPYRAEAGIAMRHLTSLSNEAMVSVTTLIAIFGVAGSVFLVHVVLAVMTGFQEDFKENVLGANAHAVLLSDTTAVFDYDRLTEEAGQLDGVKGAAPFVFTELLLRHKLRYSGAVVKGVDPARSETVVAVVDDLEVGLNGPVADYASKLNVLRDMANTVPGKPLNDGTLPDRPSILLGVDMADTLDVDVGDEVELWNPMSGTTGPMGVQIPKIRKFMVTGIYRSGLFEYDAKWVYVANADLQDFLELQDVVTGIEVTVHDLDEAPRVAAELAELAGPGHYGRHWQEMNQGLFDALNLEKRVSGLLFFLVVGIAALLILNTLILMVLTKGREIAILKAMGASRRGILRIFVFEGSLIGVVGTLAGSITGYGFSIVLREIGWPIQADVYMMDQLPVVIDPLNYVYIMSAAFAVCVLVTVYPAWRAAGLDPVVGLRGE